MNSAEHFDIHSSTIIKTEESRSLGAKFIIDDDVASAAACMKMCCETSECDVFIYEEKVSKYLPIDRPQRISTASHFSSRSGHEHESSKRLKLFTVLCQDLPP